MHVRQARHKARRQVGKCDQQHAPHTAQGINVGVARCDTESHQNKSAIKDSLCEARRGSAMRDSASESIQMSLTLTPPLTDSINERSNVALCAITGQPPTKSARAATASTADGASTTSAFVMLVSSVISAGISCLGCTKVSKRSMTSRPERRAAEISINSLSCTERPVVSVSRTITSSSMRPNDCVLARSASVA